MYQKEDKMSTAQIDVTVRMIMWIVILVLANGCYSLWKKEAFSTFLFRSLLFVSGSIIIWLI
jgi:hypothetical protein